MEYHKMFDKTQIERPVVLAVRKAIKSGLFKKENSIDLKKQVIKDLHIELCRIYELPVIEIEYQENYWSVGSYSIDEKKIFLNKTSLVTYLHEFFHYWRIEKKLKNSEELARGWSISLYFLATPKLCTSAIENGLILHQNKIKDIEEISGSVN